MRLIAFFIIFVSQLVLAQAPRVGKGVAAEFFQNTGGETREFRPHYLALHAGRFMSSQAWEWGGKGRVDNTGENTIGVTYRVGEWENSMDFAVRIDFNDYSVLNERLQKMSVLAMITFPDANSQFPLYFGIGAGAGVFFKQIDAESPLSFDYQLILGARFFDVFESTGFFIESGLKNHLHLTSDGQFNGTFAALGLVFTF